MDTDMEVPAGWFCMEEPRMNTNRHEWGLEGPPSRGLRRDLRCASRGTTDGYGSTL